MHNDLAEHPTKRHRAAQDSVVLNRRVRPFLRPYQAELAQLNSTIANLLARRARGEDITAHLIALRITAQAGAVALAEARVKLDEEMARHSAVRDVAKAYDHVIRATRHPGDDRGTS